MSPDQICLLNKNFLRDYLSVLLGRVLAHVHLCISYSFKTFIRVVIQMYNIPFTQTRSYYLYIIAYNNHPRYIITRGIHHTESVRDDATNDLLLPVAGQGRLLLSTLYFFRVMESEIESPQLQLDAWVVNLQCTSTLFEMRCFTGLSHKKVKPTYL